MPDTASYSFEPGLHSHNLGRRAELRTSGHAAALNKLRALLLVVGLSCIGYFAHTRADETIYQKTQNQIFEREKAAHVFTDGELIGRVTIGRLNLSAIVRQGVDDQTLKEAVGHVPSTALPGQTGNFAIAAHRDTLFRGLKDIQIGDIITFESKAGDFHYAVAATKIVKPSDVSVLRPDGGDLLSKTKSPAKLLTMITCYPFYYVGSAPERFIVQAKLINQ